MTEHALAELLAKDLTELDLVEVMIDGVYFAEHPCVAALGLDIDGTKHPLGLVEGSTENTTVVKDLLTGLSERGLDTTKPILAVLDGAKALAAGVRGVFDSPVIARCQLHKLRERLDREARHLATTRRTRAVSTRPTRLAFDSNYETALAVKARRDRLDAAISEMAADSDFTPLVHRLGCLRGIGTLTGFALAVEIGDWHRFTGNSIGSFVGLIPSEHSSGNTRSQGSITKTCNTHGRRLLVEAAWHHRPAYRIGKTMRERWDLAPAAARTRGDEGNRRLHTRWVRFTELRKKSTIADVAIARELAGWCWSLATLEE